MDNVNVRTAMKLNLVRPVFEKTGKIQRYGEVITLGRRVATAEARIIDQERRLYGRATTTCLTFPLDGEHTCRYLRRSARKGSPMI
jgi:uncharacterized protein (TIGR00369 family)